MDSRFTEAGAGTMVAYTADEQTRSMVSNSVATHTRPILKEVSQLTTQVRDLAEMVRGLAGEVRDLTGKVRDLDETVAENHRTLTADIQALKEAGAKRDRKLDELAKGGAARDRKLNELAKAGTARDRKLDVLSAQMRLVIGAFGLLITALIAVFGILFTR